jgi:hypothetical protein
MDSRIAGKGMAIITTGFYILSGKGAETDGPPGAAALGAALRRLGFSVTYVTDRYAAPLLTSSLIGQDPVVEFPIVDHRESRDFARGLLRELNPAIVIATERCGITANGKYLNMNCTDISALTAKIDYLFPVSERTVGVGDGGNEIGMGNLAAEISRNPALTPEPAVTKVNKLIIGSVSNWGVYGLLAALSLLVKENLLPGVEWEKEVIKEIVSRGAVDGVTGANRPSVDSFELDTNALTLINLHALVMKQLGIEPG